MQRGFIAQNILIICLVLVGATFVVFGLFRSQNILLGPSITLSEPTIKEGSISLIGKVSRSANFSINGTSIAPEQNGDFNERLFLTPGHTIITLQARDRFDRTTSLELPVYIPEYASEEINNTQEDSSESSNEGGEDFQS